MTPHMTRRLVLTNEAARHPFRRSLPPPVITCRPPRTAEDWQLFLLSFTAFFICLYTFLL